MANLPLSYAPQTKRIKALSHFAESMRRGGSCRLGLAAMAAARPLSGCD